MKVNVHKVVSKHKKKVSALMLIVMVSELLIPLKAFALTSGPSQPEFQGFTPLATTSLVEPFSGDFSYNIPLLEIEGYPLNLVYRATSNIEEEGSWVGYGWNVNVGTLNRMVRGLPDDMNGGLIKSYQNIRERNTESLGIDVEPSFGVHVGTDGVGARAEVRTNLGLTFDDDNYIGEGIGVSVGGGVYVSANAGPFSVGAGAGVTLAAHTNSGGTLSTYAGYNVGLSYGDYFSIGFGKSRTRTFNTISGWEKPVIVGSFNLNSVTRETQKSFLSSISNEVPVITNPYLYTSEGAGFKLSLGATIGVVEELGLDMGIGVTVTKNKSKTTYNTSNTHKGYGYMYAENALPTDMLDFTRDNDGGINKDMPYLPPAMKTYDVFSSTAHNASNVFRADRNDFGIVRDPYVAFQNVSQKNKKHELDIQVHFSFDCWVGVSVKYHNVKTSTEGQVRSGGCPDDRIPYRRTSGKDQNLFFKACGATAQADDAYLAQVNKYGHYTFNKDDSIRGITNQKRTVTPEPIAVYTNKSINDFPQTVIPKTLQSYARNIFPAHTATVTSINRPTSDETELSKIGAILNTNKAGQTYVYATPVANHVKNEVAFRTNGFAGEDPNSAIYREREGLMKFRDSMASQFNGEVRDWLYKNTITPSYAHSYMLNAVLSPDYADVTNNGITDDDLGSFVKFNYTKAESDYRWRVPYEDRDSNMALLNRGVKVTKFDDMASYMIGSKDIWYAHSIESKNYVVEFYLSNREDALSSRSRIMRSDHPNAVAGYTNNKDSFGRMQKLDSIKYYYKHDRYLNNTNAVPLKTIYFTYDYGISTGMPNAVGNVGKLRLTKVRVKHANEPIAFAETYDFGYTSFNPAYSIGDKDGWGNYCPNTRPIPLCEFPYIDQEDRQFKDRNASAFHMNSIGLPSGGKIEVSYEADDYAYVQNKRAMALLQVVGIGNSTTVTATDVHGLYDNRLNPYLYIYVKKPAGSNGNKSFHLNGSNLMYFSFNINIAGNAFYTYDQVKGYAEVESMGVTNDGNHLYIKVKPVDLMKTAVKPSPMTNAAINMARAFATDQLYFQEEEHSDGKNRNKFARMIKAAVQVGEALFAKNSIKELMKDFRAGHKFNKNKSYVRLAITEPKIGGGSRVSRLTFDDEWNQVIGSESSSLIGYNYIYKDVNGLSSGVASYEPLLGGEENPLRSGTSYALSNNPSKYPPYDPVELVKEDPAGESFFPTGSVGYSRVVIESIHKDYARSAQSKLVQEFYTAKDFPWISNFSSKMGGNPIEDVDYPNPGIRDILLSFLGVSDTRSSSRNSYEVGQNFLIETNDMHGKQKGTYNYRLMPKAKEELVSYTQYVYHANGSRLSNDVDVIQYQGLARGKCQDKQKSFPKNNIYVQKKTLGVDVDVCTDSREVVTEETRKMSRKGGGLKFCLPPQIRPSFTWIDAEHKHTDYFKATTTTKVVSRYGILKTVRNYKEGAETIMDNKYYDAVTGDAVVQVSKDRFGDEIYSTNIPAYWTKTDLEPAYMEYPYLGSGSDLILPSSLAFSAATEGFLAGSGLPQSSFTTNQDMFHQGDELFVRGKIGSAALAWHRLYVMDVLVQKGHYPAPDPLVARYGSGTTTGVTFKVLVAPYKLGNLVAGDLQPGTSLTAIETMFKYRSGRKNMLALSAGDYHSLTNPFVYTDSVYLGYSIPPGTERRDTCRTPSFMKPVINAQASRYDGVNALPNGLASSLLYNPVAVGILNQPYVSASYSLYGFRLDQSKTMQQRGHGILKNWYYWLPARYDSTGAGYVPLKAMLTHYDDSLYNALTALDSTATWFTASQVTKSIPSLGPVEETNPLGTYSSIFLGPNTKKVQHATSNGKFGQTLVETFEDLRELNKVNTVSDLIFSPFKKNMMSSTVGGYNVFNTSQNLVVGTTPNLYGNFTIDNSQSHTGMSCLYVTSANLIMKVNPQKYSVTQQYYSNLFDFNLDNTSNNKYTYEVWVKKNTIPVTAPIINSAGVNTALTKVSTTIDGWSLYRATVNVTHNSVVTFTFHVSQYYDDLRVFPAASNVKTYVYHPFKTYLMAVLDENNYATFYEYNNRNQLVRLKKETEKGIITITENLKNTIVK